MTRALSSQNVWIVIRDDGSSQVAEESIDSVWATEDEAETRAQELREHKIYLPFLTRVERRTVGEDDKSVRVTVEDSVTLRRQPPFTEPLDD